jgi:hypothetical protein
MEVLYDRMKDLAKSKQTKKVMKILPNITTTYNKIRISKEKMDDLIRCLN